MVLYDEFVLFKQTKEKKNIESRSFDSIWRKKNVLRCSAQSCMYTLQNNYIMHSSNKKDG